ncbi:hypothetical protein BC832DRAFT_593840 [Gaertneriomyces semiglobifer]|nr:hypothetical protein BC832DRAFT_593840 [Gaertneriomyces semiglobifer]
MVTTDEITLLYSVLAHSHLKLGQLASSFNAAYPSSLTRFDIACCLSVLLSERTLLPSPLLRLAALYILYDLYVKAPIHQHPFLSTLLNYSILHDASQIREDKVLVKNYPSKIMITPAERYLITRLLVEPPAVRDQLSQLTPQSLHKHFTTASTMQTLLAPLHNPYNHVALRNLHASSIRFTTAAISLPAVFSLKNTHKLHDPTVQEACEAAKELFAHDKSAGLANHGPPSDLLSLVGFIPGVEDFAGLEDLLLEADDMEEQPLWMSLPAGNPTMEWEVRLPTASAHPLNIPALADSHMLSTSTPFRFGSQKGIHLQQPPMASLFQLEDVPVMHPPAASSVGEPLSDLPPDYQELLQRATQEPVPSAQQQILMPHLVHHPPPPSILSSLISQNPPIATYLLLNMPRELQSSYFSLLSGLPLTLQLLEVIIRVAKDVPSEWIKEFAVSIVSRVEKMAEGVASQHEPRNIEENINDNPSGAYALNRLVRLVCVFFMALIRDGALTVTHNDVVDAEGTGEEWKVPVLAFCIQFARVREAVGLFRVLRGVEDGKQGIGDTRSGG